MTNREIILDALEEQFCVFRSRLEANPTLAEFDCDSLDFVEIIMQIEHEIDIDLDESKFPPVTLPNPKHPDFRIANPEWDALTVNDFVARIEAQLMSLCQTFVTYPPQSKKEGKK